MSIYILSRRARATWWTDQDHEMLKQYIYIYVCVFVYIYEGAVSLYWLFTGWGPLPEVVFNFPCSWRLKSLFGKSHMAAVEKIKGVDLFHAIIIIIILFAMTMRSCGFNYFRLFIEKCHPLSILINLWLRNYFFINFYIKNLYL